MADEEKLKDMREEEDSVDSEEELIHLNQSSCWITCASGAHVPVFLLDDIPSFTFTKEEIIQILRVWAHHTHATKK